MSTDDQNINNPNNPCYNDEQRKLFISKKKIILNASMKELGLTDYEEVKSKGIRQALNDTTEPTYKESNLTIKVLEDFLSSKNEEKKEASENEDKKP